MDDAPSPRLLAVAALALGGLVVVAAWFAFVPRTVPQLTAAIPTVTQGPRLPTPTPDANQKADAAYRALLLRELDAIAFEVGVLDAGVQLADYGDPSWQAMMLDAADSLAGACDRLWRAVPPVEHRAAHSDVLKMADRLRTAARILLADSGRIDGNTLARASVQFSQGADYLERVMAYHW